MTRRSAAELLTDVVLEPLLPLAVDVLREALKPKKNGHIRDIELAKLLITTTGELATKQTTDTKALRRMVDVAFEQAGAVAATPDSAGPGLLAAVKQAQEQDAEHPSEHIVATAGVSPNGSAAADDLGPPS